MTHNFLNFFKCFKLEDLSPLVIVFTGSTILNSFRIFEVFLMGELKGTPLTYLSFTGFKT